MNLRREEWDRQDKHEPGEEELRATLARLEEQKQIDLMRKESARICAVVREKRTSRRNCAVEEEEP
jgi:hypothetical protein